MSDEINIPHMPSSGGVTLRENCGENPSRYYEIKQSSHGGRGVFATHLIPADTLIHTSPCPFASLIYRAFRKEICAQCFAYAFDSGGRSSWNVKIIDADGDGSAKGGLWFCGEECKEKWVSEDRDGVAREAYTAIDKHARSCGMRKRGEAAMDKLIPADLKPQDITEQMLDAAWAKAEELSQPSLKRKGQLSPILLDESELDMARFVASALINVHRAASASPAPSSTWSSFFALQNNELPSIRSYPDTLAQSIRIYIFLRQAVPTVLQPYLDSSIYVRAVIARDSGNSFGIWQLPYMEESEMFGWGVYVDASYFNHSCDPNVRKDRQGRAFHFYTTREVSAGEELCISYGYVEDNVEKRRKRLKESWYFDCECQRCVSELQKMGS